MVVRRPYSIHHIEQESERVILSGEAKQMERTIRDMSERISELEEVVSRLSAIERKEPIDQPLDVRTLMDCMLASAEQLHRLVIDIHDGQTVPISAYRVLTDVIRSMYACCRGVIG